MSPIILVYHELCGTCPNKPVGHKYKYLNYIAGFMSYKLYGTCPAMIVMHNFFPIRQVVCPPKLVGQKNILMRSVRCPTKLVGLCLTSLMGHAILEDKHSETVSYCQSGLSHKGGNKYLTDIF